MNFRVTEEEYERLRLASDALGINGISGYARRATLDLASPRLPEEASPNGQEYLIACVADLRSRVAQLESQVDRLSCQAERVPETCG